MRAAERFCALVEEPLIAREWAAFVWACQQAELAELLSLHPNFNEIRETPHTVANRTTVSVWSRFDRLLSAAANTLACRRRWGPETKPAPCLSIKEEEVRIRTLLASSVAAVAGLGLIGVGSNAVFTQDTVSNQQITAGTMKVVISEGAATDSSGPTLTLSAFGPTNSTFTTGDHTVMITNKGNIAVQEIVATPGNTVASGTANAALASQVYLCEVSSGQVIYNGPLASAGAQAINGTLAAGATDNYSVNYYAGKAQTACGAVTTPGATAVAGISTAPSLTNEAQGGVINPTMTVSYTG